MPSSRVNEHDLDFDLDLDLAWFRCAVVSRKHAKICFADSGHVSTRSSHTPPSPPHWAVTHVFLPQVYLVDLSSHHGTHLLKVGDAVPAALAPEAPTPLADGDVVTFGKSVGKDEDLVRPVTVRVKFLLQPADHSERSQPIHIQRSASGRFGVLTDIDSSSSSSDSEVEEVGPPEVLPSNPYRAQIPSQSFPHSFGFIEQWFRTDTSHHNPQSQLQSRPSLHSQPQSQPNHEGASSSASSIAKEVINVDDYDDSQIIIPYRTTQIFTHHTDMSIPSSSVAVMTPIPIDLEDTIDNVVLEPNLVGAWPPSPRSPIDHDEYVVCLMDNIDGGEVDMNLESDVEDPLNHQVSEACENININPPADAEEEVAGAPHTPEFHPIDPVNLGPGTNAVAEPTAPTILKVLENIKEDLDSIKENVRQVSASPIPSHESPTALSSYDLQSDVWELQKSQQNTSTSVWDINRRVDSLDLRIKAMESAHETNYGKLSVMLEKEAARVDEVLHKFEEEKEEMKEVFKLLTDGEHADTFDHQRCFMLKQRSAYTEIRSLRDKTDKQMSAEVGTLKAAQKEALDAVKIMTQETQIVSFHLTPYVSMRLTPPFYQACTSHLNNLKRKRDELEEEEETERAMKTAKFCRSQVAAGVAKAVSVFTVGVIATWSALAFS